MKSKPRIRREARLMIAGYALVLLFTLAVSPVLFWVVEKVVWVLLACFFLVAVAAMAVVFLPLLLFLPLLIFF